MANARQFMAARTAAWAKSGAPLPYSRVLDFIESDGRQYICIGDLESHSVGSVLEITMTLREIPSGVYEYGVIGSFFCGLLFNGGELMDASDPSLIRWQNPVVGEIKTVEFVTFIDGAPFYVFGFADGSEPSARVFGITKVAIHNISLSDTNKLIPVLDLNGKPALFETESNALYYNQGPGEFTWGEL